MFLCGDRLIGHHWMFVVELGDYLFWIGWEGWVQGDQDWTVTGFGEVLEDVHGVCSTGQLICNWPGWTYKAIVSTSDDVVSGSADGFDVDVK